MNVCRYSREVRGSSTKQFAEAHSYHNVGMLQEILGNYKEALECYQKYCSLSKKNGDRKGLAQSYGCLGSVYASLSNHAMSITCHEQHISATKKIGDVKIQIRACEQMGDTYTKMEEHEKANESYNEMFKLCPGSDIHNRTAALLKMANSYKTQGKYQYALYYTEQAKILAEDVDFTDIKVICKLNIASILQHSTQLSELDQAKTYFQDLIPLFEAKIEKHTEEDTFCSEELYSQLYECFDGIQNVLSKLGNHRECLIYAEASRQKSITLSRSINLMGSNKTLSNLKKGSFQWSLDNILNVVHEQNATVLYYTVLNNALLLWVLQPGVGIAKFYVGRNSTTDQTIPKQIEELINSIKTACLMDEKNHSLNCENRSLPLKNTDTEIIKQKNEKLSHGSSSSVEKGERPAREQQRKKSRTLERQLSKLKSPQRKLFDLLLAPVDDFLSTLDDQTALVIVPDKVLCGCPIWTAEDWDNKPLSDYFRITIIPSIYLLDKVSRNEIAQLRTQDELEFERSQSRFGGIHKLYSVRGEPEFELYPIKESVKPKDLNLKKTSNPRLVTSGVMRNNNSAVTRRQSASRDPNVTGCHTIKTPRSILSRGSAPNKINEDLKPSMSEPLKSTKLIGSPTALEKVAGTHTFSTLTTRTSTTTDITSSYNTVPEFKQISDPHKSVVFGNPALPNRFA